MLVVLSLGTVGFVTVLAAAAMAQNADPAGPATTPGAPPTPVIGVTPPVAPVGATVRINLNNWPETFVTVMVCGDDARRGSPDCDQVGANLIELVAGEGSGLVTVNPPVACPCVVRGNTTGNSLVLTARLDVPGFAVAPLAELPPVRTPGEAGGAPATSGDDPVPLWPAVVVGLIGVVAVVLFVRRRRSLVGEQSGTGSAEAGAGHPPGDAPATGG